MLETLAIINMAVAAVLIHETADSRTSQETTEIVAVIDANTEITKDLTAK